MKEHSYWVNTVSRDHVLVGVKGGFTQANHGKKTRLEQLSKGDYLVFYSAKDSLEGKALVQAFTALGQVSDDKPYQVEMTPTFHPWRRQLTFFESTEASIRPLIEELDFIPNKKRWGFPFMRGLFEIDKADFEKIALAMKVAIA